MSSPKITGIMKQVMTSQTFFSAFPTMVIMVCVVCFYYYTFNPSQTKLNLLILWINRCGDNSNCNLIKIKVNWLMLNITDSWTYMKCSHYSLWCIVYSEFYTPESLCWHVYGSSSINSGSYISHNAIQCKFPRLYLFVNKCCELCTRFNLFVML